MPALVSRQCVFSEGIPTTDIFVRSAVNVAAATNVSLSYSVFFPENFDFVKGGKLPGLVSGDAARRPIFWDFSDTMRYRSMAARTRALGVPLQRIASRLGSCSGPVAWAR